MRGVEERISLKTVSTMDEARFVGRLEARAKNGRCKSIDGEPVMTMHPPGLEHRIIASHPERRLNDARDVGPRSRNRNGRSCRSRDDLVDRPEFGVSRRLVDLYARTDPA